ncbi:MAG: tRNA (adenosine(37)-N6)-threonylcarbamoyltransferase complex dimerization subunit type 1 TsaB [Salibacteraceae bacterium]
MALILSIESATTMCSVALAKDGELIDFLEVNDGYAHAEKLAPFVDQLLKQNSILPTDLDAMAVSAGPGSYTGLRIGVSLVKGLCYGANLPLIAIDTLQQMCLHPHVVKELNYLKDPVLCPMLDARRMEVYATIFDIGLKVQKPLSAIVLDDRSFEKELKQDAVLFFGSGMKKFKEVCQNKSAYFVPDVWPSAKQMVGLAEYSFEKGEFQDLAYFVPNYLKAFHATTPKPRL